MLCKIWARVFVCFYGPSVEVNNSGGSRGGARGAQSPSFFGVKLRPEGPKKIFSRPPHPPPPLSQALDLELNELVIEGPLQQIPNRGDR